MRKIYPNFEEVRVSEPIVFMALQQKFQLPQIIVALVNEMEQLREEVRNLEAIAPQKISHDGKTYVWHCPDEMIPEIK